MLFASRLPPGPEFILPRRGGYWLFQGAWSLFSRPAGRTVFSGCVVLLLAACAGALALSLRGSARSVPRTPSAWAGLLFGPAAALILAARLGSRTLDLTQLIWFPYGAMDAREPLVAFVLFALAFVPAAAAARAWVAGRRRRATMLFGFMVLLDAAGGAFAAAAGVGRPLGTAEAGGKTVFVVLTQGEKGPSHETYVLPPDVFNDPDPRARERALASAPRDARALRALRALYLEETKRWDEAGLREALLLGVSRNDPLAPSLLLAHLTAAVPSPEALEALRRLADEGAWRIGPLGAAALSRAYAHLGKAAQARRWAAKAGGAGGIAPGLFRPAPGGPLRPGRVAGVLRAPGRARIALYARADASAPYLLDAAGFVASTTPDSRGRFEFRGLAAGRYYLAVALSSENGRRGEVSVSGARGDLILDASRAAVDLPPLTVSFASR
jgi:hypothetical protein